MRLYLYICVCVCVYKYMHVFLYHLIILFHMQTDINSVKSQSNMQYAEISGRVFKRKSDYVNSIVRACARKYILILILQNNTPTPTSTHGI